MSEIRVKLIDVRAAGFCSAGIRTWLEHHKIDWLGFVREGAPVEQLEATGDAFAIHAARIARRRAEVTHGRT